MLSDYASLRFIVLPVDQVEATAAKKTVAKPTHIAQATSTKNRCSPTMRSEPGGAGGSGKLRNGHRVLYSKSVIVRVSCKRN